MQITLTQPEAHAVADLIDRECKLNGAQAAATFGNVIREIITAAQAEKEAENGEDHGND